MSLTQMSLSGAVMILAVAAIRALAVNRLPKRAFLVLWGVAAARLLIPFSLRSPFSVYSLLGRLPAAPEAVKAMPAVPAAPMAPVIGTAPTPAAPMENAAAVPIDPWTVVWLVGTLACGAFFAVAYWKCRGEFQASLPVENDYTKHWLSEHRIFRAIEIRQSGRISAPLTYGVLRPVILMPKTADWDDRDTLKYVLAHEYVHIRRFDAVTKLALTAALCVHWFNPAVWIMYVLANRDIELSCDEAVIREFGERTKSAYAMALIRMEETRSGLSPLCNNFSKNAIEERIVAVMKFKKTTFAGLLLALALVCGLTVGFASNPGTDIPDEESTTSSALAPLLYTVIGDPENDDFVRVKVPESGFYYDMPADGWDPYGAYFLYSAYGTDSQVEIYGTGAGGFVGEVELYKSLGYTKTEETDGLTVLARTEILEFRDGTVLTARYEVYVYGQKGPGQCWVVSLKWIEENLTADTANEPEVMRAIARSLTIDTNTANPSVLP